MVRFLCFSSTRPPPPPYHILAEHVDTIENQLSTPEDIDVVQVTHFKRNRNFVFRPSFDPKV